MKSTDPVGVTPTPVTWAVNVTDPPYTDGLTSLVSVVVLTADPVTVIAADVPVIELVTVSVAVTVCVPLPTSPKVTPLVNVLAPLSLKRKP